MPRPCAAFWGRGCRILGVVSVVAALHLVIGQLPVLGTDYHVSALRGDDTRGDGTQERPWRSISRALAANPVPGDVVLVGPGLYDAGLGETFPLWMPPGITLQGEGPGATILANAEPFAPALWSIRPSESQLLPNRVRGFSFLGDNAAVAVDCWETAEGHSVFTGNEWRTGVAVPTCLLSLDASEGCHNFVTVTDNRFLMDGAYAIAANIGSGPGSLLDVTLEANTFIDTDPEVKPLDFILEAGNEEDSIGFVLRDNLFLGDTSCDFLLGADGVGSQTALLRRNLIRGAQGGRQNIAILLAAWMQGQVDLRSENVLIHDVMSAMATGAYGASDIGATMVNGTLYGYTDGVTVIEEGSVQITVRSSILWNGDRLKRVDFGSPSIAFSYSDLDGAEPGPGNISSLPLFADAGNGDFHLLPGSPCIDAADSADAPATDYDRAPRFDDPSVPDSGAGAPPWYDMGAFEATSSNDRDGDTVPDSADCAPYDPGVWAPPEEVTGLRVEGRRFVVLSWEELPGPASLRYEIASGSLRDLHDTRTFQSATCLRHVPRPLATDPRSGPGPGEGWFYMVRAHTSCSIPGTFGDSSFLPDPRDDLDAGFPTQDCP